MEQSIGNVLEVKGDFGAVKLKVEKDSGKLCAGCFFDNPDGSCSRSEMCGECDGAYRKDKTDIIFKKI